MEQAVPAVSVVLPTYNEAESLRVSIPRIVEALRAAAIECEIVVVDDDSPDGTAGVAEQLADHYPVRVIKRTAERGLATAVLAGFAAARAPICLVMDADGSHPVSVLPEMVRMIAQDKADAVVGSRNIAGGGSRNWPLFSQLKSKLAASFSFGLTSLTDPTTGLMAIRKTLLEGLRLDPVGWKIVLEIVVKAAPLRVAEVPIVFEDRELGESKQSLKVFAQYAQHVGKLYAHRYPAFAELIKFCLVGLIGLCVDLGTVLAVKELTGLDTRLCAIFGFSVAVSTNYLFNRYFTFAHGRELPLLWSYLTYVGTNLLGLSVRMATVHTLMVLAQLDRGHGYLLSNAIGIALATLFNFAGAKYFAFAPERLAFAEDALPKGPSTNEATLSPSTMRAATLVLIVAIAQTAVALREIGWLPLVSIWATVGLSALLLYEHEPRAGSYTALLFASSPSFLSQSPLSPEATSIAFCSAGLYFCARGTRARHRALCLLGGALLGLGSLPKLSVAVPYALAACAFVLVQTTLVRRREEQPLALRRSVLAALLGFLLGAGMHVLPAAIFPTGSLPSFIAPFDVHDLGELQAIIGRAGHGTSPLWFYPAVLYREHFYLLPLTLFGLPALLRRARAYAVTALAMAFGASLGVVMLSALALEEPRYVLAVVPFLYMLAGSSLAELESDAPKYRPANTATVQAVIVVAALSVLTVWTTRLANPQSVTTLYACLHSLGMLASAAVGIFWIMRRHLAAPLVAVCATVAVALFIANY